MVHSIDHQDINGATALMRAEQYGHNEIVNIIKAFAKIKALKKEKIIKTIKTEILKFLKTDEDIKVKENNIIKSLEKNEKVNKRLNQELLNALKFGKKSNNLLHKAVKYNMTNLIKVLVDKVMLMLKIRLRCHLDI